MKTKKTISKIIALLIAVIMVLTLMPAMAFAQEPDPVPEVNNVSVAPQTLKVLKGESDSFYAIAKGDEGCNDKVTCEVADDGTYVSVAPVMKNGKQNKNKKGMYEWSVTGLELTDGLENKSTSITVKAEGNASKKKTITVKVIDAPLTVNGVVITKDAWNDTENWSKDRVENWTSRNDAFTFTKYPSEEGLPVSTGHSLESILRKAGIDPDTLEDNQLIRMEPSDGKDYERYFTVYELLREQRFKYPNSESLEKGEAATDEQKAGAEPVQTIICDVDKDMDYRLVLGQVAPNDRNSSSCLKKMSSGGIIEVLETEATALNCDVTANIENGSTIEPGTEIVLNSSEDREIYYTTDETEPSKYESALYNYDTKNENKHADIKAPEKEGPFVIKVRQTAPGSLDSNVVTFTYTVKKKDSAPTPTPTPTVQEGKQYSVSGFTYKVSKVASESKNGSVIFIKAKKAKSVTVPATVKLADGKLYYVRGIGAKAFKGTKTTKVVVKTKKLTKKSVKGCLKGSKVKKIKVKVGSKKLNKKYVKKYKKIFTKKNAGKKVSVK